jgi:hypothetical protein
MYEQCDDAAAIPRLRDPHWVPVVVLIGGLLMLQWIR